MVLTSVLTLFSQGGSEVLTADARKTGPLGGLGSHNPPADPCAESELIHYFSVSPIHLSLPLSWFWTLNAFSYITYIPIPPHALEVTDVQATTPCHHHPTLS